MEKINGSTQLNSGITEETSRRITSLRFLLAFFVVIIHTKVDAYMISELNETGMNFPFEQGIPGTFIYNVVQYGFLQAAVPLFFLFSGYLFNLKEIKYSLLVKKKVRSMLIPYLLWHAIFIIIPIALVHIELILDFKNVLLCLIGEGECFNPGLGQLWFIRDLFIVFLISPVIKKLVKFCPREFIFILFLLFIAGIQTINFKERLGVALLFFSIGCVLEEYKFNFFEWVDSFNWIGVCILFFVDLYLITVKKMSSSASMIIAIVIVLKISKLLLMNEKLEKFLAYLSGFSFFVYATHYLPLAGIIRLYWIKKFPIKNSFFYLFEFFGASVLVLLICTIAGILLRKICPKLFGLLTGGR